MHNSLFFDLALAYSFFFIFFMPLFACALIDCSADSSGSVSVSRIMRREPLCTTLAYFGGIYFLAVLHYQTQANRVIRYVLALLSAKFFCVPLILPLGAVRSDDWHDSFGFVGAVFALVFALSVCYDVTRSKALPRGGMGVLWCTVAMFASLLTGTIVFYSSARSYAPMHAYMILFCEYLFFSALTVQAKYIQHYHL